MSLAAQGSGGIMNQLLPMPTVSMPPTLTQAVQRVVRNLWQNQRTYAGMSAVLTAHTIMSSRSLLIAVLIAWLGRRIIAARRRYDVHNLLIKIPDSSMYWYLNFGTGVFVIMAGPVQMLMNVVGSSLILILAHAALVDDGAEAAAGWSWSPVMAAAAAVAAGPATPAPPAQAQITNADWEKMQMFMSMAASLGNQVGKKSGQRDRWSGPAMPPTPPEEWPEVDDDRNRLQPAYEPDWASTPTPAQKAPAPPRATATPPPSKSAGLKPVPAAVAAAAAAKAPAVVPVTPKRPTKRVVSAGAGAAKAPAKVPGGRKSRASTGGSELSL